MSSNSDFADHFAPLGEGVSSYLSAATGGLPSRTTIAATRASLDDWSAGRLDAVGIGEQVDECRSLFAGLLGIAPDRVAVGSQTSQLVSVVATGVPDGAEVLCAAGDFASLAHPFEQLRDRGVTVRYVPLQSLAEEVRLETALVAVSHVQSATGKIAPLAEISDAARASGARVLVDLTQSFGWLPADASLFDYSVCHAYKWLCAPRGVAFLTMHEGLEDALTPIAAGWCSADDVWASCYTDHMPLAAGVGRFDVSPAWQAIPGARAALELFSTLDADAVHAHAVGLANRARTALGLPSGRSAIVTWPDADGRDLAAMRRAGIVASGRSGRTMVSFHLWNTEADVENLARVLCR